MCYPIERTTIRVRAANRLSETLHFCRSYTMKIRNQSKPAVIRQIPKLFNPKRSKSGHDECRGEYIYDRRHFISEFKLKVQDMDILIIVSPNILPFYALLLEPERPIIKLI